MARPPANRERPPGENSEITDQTAETTTEAGGEAPRDWAKISRENYQAASSYMDEALRKQWDRNIRSFQGRHPSGSKYSSDEYRHRSKLFRPKIRSTIRRSEAAAAAALFSTADVVEVKPTDDNVPAQQASAEINKALMNHHLQKSMPWFVTAMAAFQTAQAHGVVASKQYWKFEEVETGAYSFQPETDPQGVPAVDEVPDPETGEVTYMPRGEWIPETRVTCDRPEVELLPPENVMMAPDTYWIEPAQASPYLIIRRPMFLTDIEARMGAGGSKTGQPEWKTYSRGEILSAGRRMEIDSTRQERERSRSGQDRFEATAPSDEFTTIWVLEHWARFGGIDYYWWTLGSDLLLTEPVEAYDVFQSYDRPVVIGIGMIEAFRPYPASKIEVSQDLTQQGNDLVNQRIDNVRLSMNPRWLARRGGAVDLDAVKRSTPGGVILLNDPTSDVKMVEIPDVTGNAYQEQNRLDVDFDDITGTFAPSSVQNNRQLNETVGGMKLLSGGANAITEYDLRAFVETWVEPVLNDVLTLIQRYETDERVLAVAGAKAQLYERFGMSEITDHVLEQQLTLSVNVGIGSTDPMAQLQKFQMAMQMIGQFLQAPPAIMAMFDLKAIISEIFGKAGYKDGMRFFKIGQQDPTVLMLMKKLEEASKAVKTLEDEAQLKLQAAQISAQATMQREQVQAEAQIAEQQIENQGDLDLEMLRQQGAIDLERRRQAAAQQEAQAGRGMRMTEMMITDAQKRRDQAARFAAGGMRR